MANFTVKVPVITQDDPQKYLAPTDRFRAITFLRQEGAYGIFRVTADNKLMAASRASYYIKHVDYDRKIIVRKGEGKLQSWFKSNEYGEMQEVTPD